MYSGKHYETGTLSNAMAALGAPVSEALALGASGGIAFGYFVFEYKGDLPHVALLTRNTFSPFERMLDNLAIRRESRETTDGARAEKNLRIALDDGHFPLVWADAFSLPYLGLPASVMWLMKPLLVIGYEGDGFLVVDGAPEPIRLPASVLAEARGKVKKDRHRMMILERPNQDGLAEGINRGIETAIALMLDKPPAGSADNFGIQGMRALAKALTDTKGPKAWRTKFEPGPRLVQALAGRIGQPGVWDWIETWGTASGADRATYAAFLREVGPHLNEFATMLERSHDHWQELAARSMPDEIAEFKELKRLKKQYADSREERPELRPLICDLLEQVRASEALASKAGGIQAAMAESVMKIADLESEVFNGLRESLKV